MPTIHSVRRSRAARILRLAREIGPDCRQVPVIQACRLADPPPPMRR